jgi:hypothetical protein
MGHVSDHTGLRAVFDGLLVQRLRSDQPFLAIHVQLACQCTVRGGLPALIASSLGRCLAHTIGSNPDATISADRPEPGELQGLQKVPRLWE